MTTSLIDVSTLIVRLRDADKELALLDVREEGQFGAAHMLWAVNVPYSRLEASVAALVPRRETPIALIDAGDGVAARAARRLAHLGYEVLFILNGGIDAWTDAGHPLFQGVYVPGKILGEWAEHAFSTPDIDAQALRSLQSSGTRPVLVLDPRSEAEHAARHVPGAQSCPNGDILHRQAWRDTTPDTLLVVACGGRTRGIIGAQTLRDAGIDREVVALRDGNHGWQLAGLPLEQGLKSRVDAPRPSRSDESETLGRQLAQRYGVPRISLSQWQAWQGESERTHYLLDVRQPAEFVLGHLPGATNAPGGQLIQAGDRWLATLRARVVLVDDDGLRAVQSAIWLRRLGWDAYALTVEIIDQTSAASVVASPSGLNADAAARVELALGEVQAVAPAFAPEQAQRLLAGGAQAIYLDRSDRFLAASPVAALWANRARLEAVLELARRGQRLVLFSEDGRLAQLAAVDLYEAYPQAELAVVEGGLIAWREAGLSESAPADGLSDAARIDFLFWAHDRRRGNAQAMRAYLDWEKQLLEQAAREPAGFPLSGGPGHRGV